MLVGQVEVVQQLLKYMTALAENESKHEAGRAAHVIELAMKPCAETGITPLHLAATLGNNVVMMRVLDIVLAKHVEITHTGTESESKVAAQSRLRKATVKALNARTHAPRNDAVHDCTPLFFAAQSGNLFCVRQLCACRGINVDRANSFGATPLHVAVERKHSKVILALLKAGADPNKRTQVSDKGAGITPVHLAVYNGDHKRTQMLLLAGANLRVMGNVSLGGRLRSERLLSVFMGDFEVAHALNKAGKRVAAHVNKFSQNWITLLRENTGCLTLSEAREIDATELRRRYVWKTIIQPDLPPSPKSSDGGDMTPKSIEGGDITPKSSGSGDISPKSSESGGSTPKSREGEEDLTTNIREDGDASVASEAESEASEIPVSPAGADSALDTLANSLLESYSTTSEGRGFMSMTQLARVLLRLGFGGPRCFGQTAQSSPKSRRLCFAEFLGLVFHRLADNERVLHQGVLGSTVIPKENFLKYFPRLICLRQLMDDWSEQRRLKLREESHQHLVMRGTLESIEDTSEDTYDN